MYLKNNRKSKPCLYWLFLGVGVGWWIVAIFLTVNVEGGFHKGKKGRTVHYVPYHTGGWGPVILVHHGGHQGGWGNGGHRFGGGGSFGHFGEGGGLGWRGGFYGGSGGAVGYGGGWGGWGGGVGHHGEYYGGWGW